MDQDNDQENKSDASVDVSLKHRRGLPRKHLKYNLKQGENPNLNCVGNTRIRPRFEGLNGNQPRQANSINDANDIMVGHSVYSIIEAAFVAGYLLTVSVGNFDTTLRGVVFKPGHFVPTSAENDMAPNVQMIRRNEISFPRERNEQHVNSRRNGSAHSFNEPAVVNQVPPTWFSNLEGSKSKHVQLMSTQSASPLMTRGIVVPVMLQTTNLSNRESISNQPYLVVSQPAYLVASKGKQVSEVVDTSNERKPTNQMPTVRNQIFPT
ncbi:uncharacterized protein LOC111288850 [Durio zibethinus]|uniref:Uncharacterized protein LOC111288850 n=1 Tax=Durio zibethinus TaxID=66656 RepID=A0A6P5Y531_DURZI|nr:uncharacterized protein LOC111288850 [Durio zibethinus]